MGRYHAVKSDLSGKPAELVAVSIVVAIDIYVMLATCSVSDDTLLSVLLTDFVPAKAGVAIATTATREKIRVFKFIILIGDKVVVIVINLRVGGA